MFPVPFIPSTNRKGTLKWVGYRLKRITCRIRKGWSTRSSDSTFNTGVPMPSSCQSDGRRCKHVHGKDLIEDKGHDWAKLTCRDEAVHDAFSISNPWCSQGIKKAYGTLVPLEEILRRLRKHFNRPSLCCQWPFVLNRNCGMPVLSFEVMCGCELRCLPCLHVGQNLEVQPFPPLFPSLFNTTPPVNTYNGRRNGLSYHNR